MDSQLQTLISMGFSEDIVKNALQMTSGDVDNALEILLSQFNPDEESQQQTRALQSLQLQSDPNWTMRENETLTQCEMSQFSFDCGKSACTPIACHAAINLLERLQESTEFQPNTEIITEILFSGVQTYQNNMAGRDTEHSSVEEVLDLLPDLKEKISSSGDGSLTTFQGLTSNPQGFSEIFQQIYSSEGMPETQSIAVIITKPPETILVILAPSSQPSGLHYIFDSHSRTNLGLDGAYLYSTPDMECLNERLRQIFPYQNFGDADDIMSVMYNSFDATALCLKHT